MMMTPSPPPTPPTPHLIPGSPKQGQGVEMPLPVAIFAWAVMLGCFSLVAYVMVWR